MARYRAWAIRDALGQRTVQSILDVGSGPGDIIQQLQISTHLIRQAKRVDLLDFESAYLAKAKRRFGHKKKFSFLAGDIWRLQPARRYDLIILVDVLEHISRPVELLRRLRSWLTARGVVFIAVPNAVALHRRVGREMGLIRSVYELGPADRAVEHKRYYDRTLLQRHIRQAGFKIRFESGLLLKPLPNSLMSGLPSEYCDALYTIGRDLPEYCAELVITATRR